MIKSNPIIIPRNNIVEESNNDAAENNNFKKFKELLDVLKNPKMELPSISNYQSPGKEKKYITYCGT